MNDYNKMERGLIMALHSLLIGLVLYGIMVLVLKQNKMVAETRSVFIAGIALVYMVAFGHGMPTSINSHLKI
jgi:hypothetical protein